MVSVKIPCGIGNDAIVSILETVVAILCVSGSKASGVVSSGQQLLLVMP